ncbi:MAG: hypothetical protein DLD55_04995 [candidate division SR1 bacterium]|nr:MAG: hypothetical protein DLD55_04995 [candidate division SR1 bacterium]
MVNLKQLEDNIKTFDDIVENLNSFNHVQEGLDRLINLNKDIQKDLKLQQQSINSEQEIIVESFQVLAEESSKIDKLSTNLLEQVQTYFEKGFYQTKKEAQELQILLVDKLDSFKNTTLIKINDKFEAIESSNVNLKRSLEEKIKEGVGSVYEVFNKKLTSKLLITNILVGVILVVQILLLVLFLKKK